jgi:hypothetical protein
MAIEAGHATATTVALAILRGENGPMDPSTLRDRIRAVLPGISAPTMWKLRSKLEGRKIQVMPSGWLLIEPAQAPVLSDGFLDLDPPSS